MWNTQHLLGLEVLESHTVVMTFRCYKKAGSAPNVQCWAINQTFTSNILVVIFFFFFLLSAESEVLFSLAHAENRSCPDFTRTESSTTISQQLTRKTERPWKVKWNTGENKNSEKNDNNHVDTQGCFLLSIEHNQLPIKEFSYTFGPQILSLNVVVVSVWSGNQSSVKLRLLPMTAGMDSSAMWLWVAGDTIIVVVLFRPFDSGWSLYHWLKVGGAIGTTSFCSGQQIWATKCWAKPIWPNLIKLD